MKLDIFVLLNIVLPLTVEATGIIGVSDKDQHLYMGPELFCPSNGKRITKSMINDGRCDCPEDGFDEPGTAACEKGKFYCKNLKGIDEQVASFKVNDGICDCCDGSDEYFDPFGVKCPNTCETVKKNHVRNTYLEKLMHKKAQKYFEKSKIKAKEKQEELRAKLTEINSKIEELEITPSDLSVEKGSNRMETLLAEYRLKLDELESLIANLTATRFPSRDSESEVEPTVEKKSTWRSLIDVRLQLAKDAILKLSYRPTVTVTKYLPTVVTKTVIQYEPTSTEDDRTNDLDYEKEELLNQAKELEVSINDQSVYGPHSVFLPLKSKCFEYLEGKFTYNLCWFDNITQKENPHGSEFTIGKWQRWDEISENLTDFKTMIYDDGNWCGEKARESRIHLVCGWRNEIISVEETSTCFYQVKFSTPLACVI